MSEIIYKEKDSKTYEVIAQHKSDSGNYTKRKVVYRFWEVDDGDWKLQIIDSEDDKTRGPFLLPKKVIDKIINVSVKGELKK